MIGTQDLTDWERGFVESLVERSDHGKNTLALSVNQIGRLVEIYNKHFADAEPA